ncbi:MAG: TonB-dependent receptor [Bacteroidota bacterium]
MKKVIYILTLLLLAFQAVLAQEKSLSGRVLDSRGDALPGANILVNGTEGTSTDVYGNYNLQLTPGSYSVEVSYIGYDKVIRQINISNSDLSEDFKLTPAALQLSDLVVTVDQKENLTRLSNYDLKQRPLKNSQEVLRMIPGLFIAQHAGGGKAEQIFLRGFDIDHGTDINLSVDGMPVNMVSHAHGQGYSDLHFVIPETIQQVEFDKGPYEAGKGDFTTAGYAQFRTFNDIDSSSLKVEGGQFGYFRTVAMIDLLKESKRDENAYLAGEAFMSDGYFESPQNFNRFNVLGKYNRRLSDKVKISLSASSFSSRWDASGQIPQRAVKSGLISRFGAIDDTEGGTTSRSNINLKLDQIVSRGGVFNHQLYFIDYQFDLVSNFTFFLNDTINGDQIRQRENRKIYGYNGIYSKEKDLGRVNWISEYGASIRYDDVDDIRLSNTLDKELITNDLAFGDVNQANFALWTSQTLALSDKLSVNTSLRYDQFSFKYNDRLSDVGPQHRNEGIISPKVKLNYKLNEQFSTYFKAGIGFHSNDSRTAIQSQQSKILPKARGLDLGFIYKPAPSLLINTTLWNLDLDQEFVYVGDEGIVEPNGQTIRRGVDFSIRYQLNDKLSVDTDLTYTRARFVNATENNNHIPLAPEWTNIGGLSYQWTNRLKASLRYRYLGPRPANEDYSVTAEGYFLVDAAVSYTTRRFEIGLSAENILDQDWNEAQFLTESRLKEESESFSEIHFTPGSPLFLKASVQFWF